jgi:hypothetical protein
MEWLVLFQNPYNRIIFISSQNPDERDSLEYYKFLEFVNKQFVIKDFINFKDQLDRFKIIHIIKEGTWEIVQDLEEFASFQDLYKINRESLKEEDKVISPTEIIVNKSKDWLNKIFDQRRKDNGIKYRDRRK